MSIEINKKLSTKDRYRPEIDGLRAFAVIAVIINHLNKDILPGGYLGVDIFFVISGFVITSSLYQRPSKNFKDFISGFYERRIKRLVPALSVFVLIMSISICLFNRSPGTSLQTGIASLFGLSNIYLFKRSTDYFAQSTELNIFTHTWSLGVEEQFYILFPLLIWFSGFGRQTKKGTRNLFLTVGTLTITSLIGFLYLYSTNQSAAYFLMPSRFWEIASGCLLFIGLQKRKSIEQLLEKIPPILVLALMIGVMYLPISFATTSTFLVVFLSLVLIASLKKRTKLYKFFINSRVVYIGRISYSLYLWHWGILSISRWTIGIHWWSVPFQVALMFCLASTSYRYIETPLRKDYWFGKRWITMVISGGVLVALSGGLIALGKPLKRKLYLEKGNYRFEKLITRSRNFDDSDGAYNGKNCHFKNKDFELSASLEHCLLKSQKGQRTFFFAGNSHTDHHRTLHYKLHNEKGVGIFSTSISNCIFLEDNNQDDCTRNSQYIIKTWILENIKQGDVVVISNRNISNFEQKKHKNYSWLTTRSSIEEINEFSKLILSKGGKVVLFAPTPEFDISLEECKPNWFRSFTNLNCTKTIEQVKEEKSKVYFLINNYLDKKIHIYDPIPDICFKDICSMTDKKSKPLYVDDDHLSDYANSEYLFPGFLSFLEKQELL